MKQFGPPGAAPIGVLASFSIVTPPLSIGYGDWYLGAPLFGPWVLPAIPASGMIVLLATLPRSPPGPYSVFVQAAGRAPLSLTNLCEIEVERPDCYGPASKWLSTSKIPVAAKMRRPWPLLFLAVFRIRT
ncbi:MAG: hypothetical protein HY812_06120 [Planctomycetes bacterium]|nr:hypothetical protein [Planctomycetota bacterium]